MTSAILKTKILVQPFWKAYLTQLTKQFCDCNAEEKKSACKDPCEDDEDENDDDPKNKKDARIISLKDALLSPEDLADKQRHHEEITIRTPMVVRRICGVPDEHVEARRVRIFVPAKNAMQSGTDNIQYWQIEFDTRERWENPLMGWTSSGDPLSNMSLQFPTKEDAIYYCERNEWTWYVQEKAVVKPMKLRPYADNFSWNTRKRTSTK